MWKVCSIKKVTSSRNKKQTVILAETELDTAALADAIRHTGYEVGDIQKEPYKRKAVKTIDKRNRLRRIIF